MDNHIQNKLNILGVSDSFDVNGAKTTTIAAVTLTGSYDDTTNVGVVESRGANEGMLYVYYTMGSSETANSIQVKLSFSPDSIALSSALWAQETAEVLSGSTITLTRVERSFSAVSAAGTYDVFCIPVHLNDGYMKVNVKETGIATNGGKCYIKLVQRGR